MHVPDGYVSPQTCVVALAATVPFWVVATRKVSDVVKTKDVPLLAMFSALSFLIMMFNIPLPGGTSAHAVGAVVVAIVLGPWAAVVAVSVALALQALVFGDGGVLA
ncbi:MAG: energy-coupling factor ABC transporter permease, partial [Micrococcales bacterium]|nr:energy-coupling factor ABC transporter permease [Micrococcales bacterium]